jgi:hypothetical protein
MIGPFMRHASWSSSTAAALRGRESAPPWRYFVCIAGVQLHLRVYGISHCTQPVPYNVRPGEWAADSSAIGLFMTRVSINSARRRTPGVSTICLARRWLRRQVAVAPAAFPHCFSHIFSCSSKRGTAVKCEGFVRLVLSTTRGDQRRDNERKSARDVLSLGAFDPTARRRPARETSVITNVIFTRVRPGD